MTIAIVFQTTIEYFKTYYKPIIIAVLIINTLVYFMSDSEYYRAVISCILRGNLSGCFNGPAETCQQLDHGKSFGWCNDPDNYGAYPGKESGPYGFKCNDWIWNKRDCPPVKCSGKYPYGLEGQKPYKKWGWCADKGVNRSMRGKMCGPNEGKCYHWIWDPKRCPKSCPSKLPLNVHARARERVNADIGKKDDGHKEEVCSNVCGTIKGKQVPCPPKCTTIQKDKESKCSNQCGMINGVYIQCPPPACYKTVVNGKTVEIKGASDECICPQ